MFKIVSKSGNFLYGVYDTDDNTTEFYTMSTLMHLVKKSGIEIEHIEYFYQDWVRRNQIQFDRVFDKFLFQLNEFSPVYDSNISMRNTYAELEFKDWGSWHKSKESKCQVLDKRYEDRLMSIRNKLILEYPRLLISVQTGDKNYIYIHIKLKPNT